MDEIVRQKTETSMTFLFDGFEFRSVFKNDEPWFIASDVCSILLISSSRGAISRLDEDEKGVFLKDTLGGKQKVSIVNESGLYSLILGSRKPEAKKFKKWVTSEVLPQIRRRGSFQGSQPQLPFNPHDLSNPKEVIKLLQLTMDSQEKILTLESDLHDSSVKAEALVVKSNVLYAKCESQKITLEHQRSSVEHSDSLLDSDSLMTSTIVGNTKGVEMSAKALNEFLCDHGVLRRVSGVWVLRAKHLGKGLGKLIPHTYISRGATKTTESFKWSEEGRKFILEICSKVKEGAA